MDGYYFGDDAVWPDPLTLRLALLTVFVVTACTEKETVEASAIAAQRIVTLAPNLAELVYAVGAGEQLVGVSAWSDYPDAVLDIPVIGDAFALDQERLALARPDILLVWESGMPVKVVDELRAIGYNVAPIKTRGLDDIGEALLQIGRLTGHDDEAIEAATAFRSQLQSLRRAYQGLEPIRVFYQVASRPLYTINSEHYISEMISLCGGENIFDDLSELAPTVDVEAVVDRDPEVLLASTDSGKNAFYEWQRWPGIAANRAGNHFLLPADEIGRASTRVIVAAKAMCSALQQARSNLDTRAQQ